MGFGLKAELCGGDKLSLVVRFGIVVLLITLLLSQVGLPSSRAALDTKNIAERFLSVLVEARVEGQSNSIHVTQTFLVKTNGEKIKHGLILNFPIYDRTYNPPVGPMSYEFIKATIQSQAERADQKANSEFPIINLKPESTPDGLSLKVGDPTVELSPGVFKFSLEYRVKNSIFSLKKSHEGARIRIAKPYGFVADDMRAVFFPPNMVTKESITAASFVEARVSDGEKSYLKNTEDVKVTVGGDRGNVNIAGEPIPFVASNATRPWLPDENLVLLVEWPKGFVLRENYTAQK